MTLEQHRLAYQQAKRHFETLLSARFHGATKWEWYRALSNVRGEPGRRNDDTSRDAAMAADGDIAAAHETFIRLLHVFYVKRDGPNGALGGRGL